MRVRIGFDLFCIFFVEISEASVALVASGLYLNKVDDPRPHGVTLGPEDSISASASHGSVWDGSANCGVVVGKFTLALRFLFRDYFE